MNLKTTVPLAVAVVLGLVAAIVASQLVKQRPVAVSAPGQDAIMNLSDVVVAARDIAPGTTLATEDLKVLRIESASAPTNVASNPSTLFSRVAKLQIPAGQMIHESLLAEKGVEGGLPGVIAPGYRAFTMEINEFTGVAGMLEPGNRIDILARVAEAEGGGQMSRTIVQNVQIIAVGSNLTAKNATGEVAPVGAVIGDAAQQQPQKAMPRSVTVLVTPEDAEKIDLACASNNARIVLRASNDVETAHVAGATVASLRGNQSRADRGPQDAQIAASHKNAADSVFGTEAKSPFRRATNTVTVIRAGVITTTDVDEAAEGDAEPTAEPTATPTGTPTGVSASAGE